MPLFEWTNAVSVNNPEIDTQHKKLFGMVNNLHDAMSQGKGKEVLSTTLEELVTYTKTHFAYEEAKMQKEGYPGFVAHKAEHNQFTEKVVGLVEEYQNGRTGLSVEIALFLKDWLVNHIQVVDKKAFLK